MTRATIEAVTNGYILKLNDNGFSCVACYVFEDRVKLGEFICRNGIEEIAAAKSVKSETIANGGEKKSCITCKHLDGQFCRHPTIMKCTPIYSEWEPRQ